MSQQMLRLARPTKIEFIRLRRRLATARRLHRVLRDRLLILTQELVALYREVVEHRLRIHEEIVKCEKELIRVSSYVAPWTFEEFSNIRVKSFSVVVGSRIVAGVKLPLLEHEVIEGRYDPSTYPITLKEVSECYEDVVKRIIRLTEAEMSLLEVGREVQKVKRKVNALENLIIPRLRATIKYLRMKFEEREREDKIRRKRIKQVLSRKARI
ncbi:MAG: V-type ATP synthase subunit D [Zestosphaera sp.]